MTLRRPHRWSHIKPSLWGQIRLSQPYTEYWSEAWRLFVQDGGKTVKLFADGDAAEAISARNAALAEMLGVSAGAAAAFTQAVPESEGQPQRFR